MNYKWSKILGGAGAALGLFAALNKGIADISQIIGYALGVVIVFLILGFVIDLIASKSKIVPTNEPSSK